MTSSSRLGRTLRPAKKALKRFTKTIQSKIQNLNFPEAIKGIRTSANRLLAYCSLHFFLPFKKRFLARPPSYCRHRDSRAYQYYSSKNQIHSKNFSPIYIDQLYDREDQSVSVQTNKHLHAQASASTSRGKEVVDDQKVVTRQESSKAKEGSLYSVEDAWRVVVARSPQLRPVDERAEEFINKFHEDMKLQKERSILAFEERLARSG